MENGLFSTSEFSNWSQKHVMFLHVTTRLKNREFDGLLKEKGFAGFPSLAFMDADGDLIARHSGARDLARVQKTSEKADAYVALRERVESGDAVARQHIFVQELALGRYDYASGSLRLASMRTSLPAKLIAKADQELIDLQYQELTRKLRGQRQALGKQYIKRWGALQLQFFQANRLPSGNYTRSVLSSTLNHARTEKDAELFAKALEVFRHRFPGPGYARRFEMYERQLQELRDNK